MEYTNIYALEDPITNQIRYIGKTNNPSERYRAHLNKARKHQTHKKNWLLSLKKRGLKPNMIIIDKVLITEWKFWEKYWIEQFYAWGFNLTNYMGGGEGTDFGNQTSFKKGHVPWNTGKGNTEICETCNIKFKCQPRKNSEHVFCSRDCYAEYQKENLNDGNFNKGHSPWNKGESGYRLSGQKQSKKVVQLDMNNDMINEFLSATDAAKIMGCCRETIRKRCVGKNKIYKNFKWKYKEDLI